MTCLVYFLIGDLKVVTNVSGYVTYFCVALTKKCSQGGC